MKPPKLPKGAIKPRPAVLAMAPYSPPTGGRANKLRLDFNENTVGCSPAVIAALKQNLDAGQLAVYPEYSEAKEAVARYFHVRPEQFVFTNGTDEAIQVFINAYVDDGQEVLLLKPAYAMYRFYAQVAGACIREVEYPRPGMEFPLQAVLSAITPETRAVMISNPNNPTGTGLELLAIERILSRARKAVVMVDEAYFEFSGVTAIAEIERVPNLFVCRTFSKVFGMAGMRLGCLFSHEANIAYLHKAQSPYSVNSLAVVAAQAAVRDTAYVENYVAEVLAARELLCFGLEKLGIRYVPSSANFVLGHFGKRAIEIRDALRGQGILVRDRSYEAPGCVRITVGTREQTRRLLAALEGIWKP
ncbi:MAG TPA: histidinol-phosphate transaminase [Candidatus Solibacter sp.]|jgi:histidinol-phosphate aminotransferase|nr:histidinol-phosphate transaminase [Candidatus Solibacter sp.]